MRRLLLLGALATLSTGCADRRVTRTDRHAVTVVIRDFRLSPQRLEVPAGRVAFAVRNAGSTETSFVLERGDRPVAAVPTLPPGGIGTLAPRLRPGVYRMTSSHGKDEVLGQYGFVTVRG